MPDESSNSTSPPLTILGKGVISVQHWYRRTSVRSLVFLIFLVVVFLHLFLRSSESLHTLQAAAALAILYVLWPFLRGTHLLRQKRTISLQASYRVVDNLRFGELWVYRAKELADLGFKFVACLEKSPDQPLVTTLVAIFVHPENGESAQLAKIQNSLSSIHLVVFNTRFDDGLVLETSNGHRRPIFRRKVNFPTFRFPQVRNLEDLYQIHRAISGKYTGQRKPVAATAELVVPTFIETAEQIHSLNVSQGDYKLSESGGHYVYTWKGAFRHNFLQTWPVISIRHLLAASDANKICESLGFRINPKFGRIEPFEQQTKANRS
jgi:hypothetical protein